MNLTKAELNLIQAAVALVLLDNMIGSQSLEIILGKWEYIFIDAN